jgi:hypothetical protein
MPRSGAFLEAVISYYSNLTFETLSALRSTQEDLRTGTFQVDKTISKAVSLWLDATEGWFSALLVTASEPLPTAFLRLGPFGGTATQEVHVLVSAQPEFTGLDRLGGGARLEADKDVKIEPLRDGNGLQIKLTGPKRPQPGLYMGLVHIGDKPLVVVMLRVDPAENQGDSYTSPPGQPVVPKPQLR